MRRRTAVFAKRAVTWGMSTALAMTCMIGTAGSSEAASECWLDQITYKLGPYGESGGFYIPMRCNNRVGVPMYSIPDSGGTNVDTLWTNPSWFICYTDDGGPNGEGRKGPHPNRWIYTQGDDHGNLGWVSDRDISSETNSLMEC
jgi:hypothetical protein